VEASLHQRVIAALDEDIAVLQGKLTQAKAAREWHAAQLAANGVAGVHRAQMTVPEQIQEPAKSPLAGMKQADAICQVLRDAGRALRPAEIVDALERARYKPGLKRAVLLNATYTAMRRREDLFQKHDGGTWALVERQGAEDNAP